MRTKYLLLTATTCVAALCGSVRKVFACKCPMGQTAAMLPVPGSQDVPVNTLIWMSNGTAGKPKHVLLRSSDRTEVALSRTTIQNFNGIVHIFIPDATLLANEEYEVGKYVYGEYYGPYTTFTTGDLVDTEPPIPPVETNRTSTSWNFCSGVCSDRGSSVTLEIAGDGLIVFDIGGTQTLNLNDLSGFTFTTTSESGEIVLGGGTDGCIGLWPGARGETLTIRYGTFDLAGNFSGWTEESTVTMPEIPERCSCNCTTTRPRDIAPIALVVLGLLLLHWLRRRRKGTYPKLN